MVLVTAAMDAELQAFFPGERLPGISDGFSGFRETHLEAGAGSFTAAVIGVGKSMSACRISSLLERYSPSLVIHVGICGAAGPALQIGDIIFPDRVMQYDLNLEAFGLPAGVIPYSGIGTLDIACAQQIQLIEHMKHCSGGIKIHRGGTAASGDTFLSPEEKAVLLERPGLSGVSGFDMESYSAALACSIKGTPMVLCKSISDDLHGNRPKRFSRYLETVSGIFRRAVISYLEAEVKESDAWR